MSDNKGLEQEYIKRVCWKGRKGKSKCRFLRYVMVDGKVVAICAKNTAAGIKHSEKIDEMLKGTSADVAENIHSADNCDGRAGEFTHLLPKTSQN